MTKTKSTKRALLMSALSLLMCVSMLIGSTFAWFTDSVTSSGNKIVAGALDIQLLMDGDVDGTYDDISNSTSPVFGSSSLVAQNNNADTLWEPGKTQVAYLAIRNNGNLALKYTVGLNVKNVSKNLYEVMEYAIVPDADVNNKVTSWTSGNSVVEGTQSVSGDVSLAVGATHYFALAIHMNEEASNTYQGGEVDFDLTVMATQDTVEADSFGTDYDKDAAVLVGRGTNEEPYVIANASQLALISENIKNNVAADSGNVSYASASYKLMNDIDLAGQEWTPIGTGANPFNGTFDGNGKTISNVVLNQEDTDASSLVNKEGDYGYAYGFFGVIGWQTGEHKNEKITIKNLNLDVSYETDEAYVFGGLVGADAAGHKGSGRNSSLACDIEISNITVNGKIISKNNKSGATVGGIAGKLYTKGNIVIDGCTNNAEVSASETPAGKDNKVGGILGFYSGANSAVIINNTNNGNVTSQSAREAGSKASGICITGTTKASVNISNNTNNGDITGTENAVVAIAFSGNDNPICMVTDYTTENNSNSGKLYTLNYQTFDKTEVLYTFLVYGGKSQTPADNTTDDSRYTGGVVVMEINEVVAGQ